MEAGIKIIVVGGSAGCLPVLIDLLQNLPESLNVPVVLVIHRLRNVVSEMDKILSFHSSKKRVIEPDDKEPIGSNGIYLAPQNYHLLVEKDHSFSFDCSEAVNYSRPSIDVSFESIANVFTSGVLAILLSGASSDGTIGVKRVLEKNGIAIIQDPLSAEYPFMPQNAIKHNKNVKILSPKELSNYLRS